MSADLVKYDGPVVRFRGGGRPFTSSIAVPYDVPRNTLDDRYEQCTDHHVACDCREAEQAEQLNEYQMEDKRLRDTLNEVLAAHDLYGTDDGRPGCLCTGCQIARKIGGFVPSAFQSPPVDWSGVAW